jgi:hypothetical protein
LKSVIFVGDRPSKKNLDPAVAFVGTPSFINLQKWIAKMQLSNFIVINSHTEENMATISGYWNAGHQAIVALGNDAAKRLERAGLPYFKLPHPSPRNRLLNDPKYIDSQISKCYDYIQGIN